MIEEARHWENGHLFRYRVVVPRMIEVTALHERIVWADDHWHGPYRPGYTIHVVESQDRKDRFDHSKDRSYFYFRRFQDAMSYLLRWGAN